MIQALQGWLPTAATASGLMLLVPAALLPTHRAQGALLVLALLLASGFLQLCWLGDALAYGLPLAVPASVLVATSLLERGRFYGLLLVGTAAGALGLYILERLLGWWMPVLSPLALLPLALVMALVTGLLGGMHLSLHPRRVRDGAALWHLAPQGLVLTGWLLLTGGLAGVAEQMHPGAIGISQLAAMLVGGFMSLLQAQGAGSGDGLQKAGEGMAAGLLISLLAPASPMAGAALGLVAAFCVARGEALALALRLADAHRFTGALLLPAMLGLLVPGLMHAAQLAPQLAWLGAALGSAAMLALLLWPLAMLICGVALPARLVREGVQR